MVEPDAATRAALQRVAAHEAAVQAGVIARVVKAAARTSAFAPVYRRTLARTDAALYRRTAGRLARWYGLPGLVLTTTGARTGARRDSPLLYVREGDAFVVAGTNWGQPSHPGWTANLLACPDAHVQVGAERLRVRAHLATDDEWARLWQGLLDVWPGYALYLERAGGRRPRIFVLEPTGSAWRP